MMRSLLVLLYFLAYIQFEGAVLATKTFFNDNTLLVEGNNYNSSEIKSKLIDRNVSKIRVYQTNTFYADEDLKLNGVVELQIFANTWHCTQPVTFDLSGTNADPPNLSGSPGSNKGNDGNDGGDFFGLAKRVINCDYLNVISNGGNGHGDVNVLLDVESETDGSGWVSSAEFHNYYQKYFFDRGYDVEIGGIDDYTALYTVLVYDKIASFDIRLHPQKCCGRGGRGGRRGTFHFKHIGNSETTPIFVGNDGLIEESGKNGTTCENRGLDVRIYVEVFPLQRYFTSKFTILNHINSSKCALEYARSGNNEQIAAHSTDPSEVDLASFIVPYKMFLLENMKYEVWKSVAEETYEAIDENRDLNDHNSLEGLLLETCELERRYSELKEIIDLKSVYHRLYNRVQNFNPTEENKEEELIRWRLRTILELKLNDVESKYNVIVDLKVYVEVTVSIMHIRHQRLSKMTQFNNVELQTRVNRLQFEVNGKFILTEYDYIMKTFQATYFPFAVEYFDTYNMSTALSDYDNLEHIHSTAINKLNSLTRTIHRMKWASAVIMNNLENIDYSSPSAALFVWKHSDISRDNIRKLFAGEKITLLADIKQSPPQFNAMKFNKIDLYFRSPEQNVTEDLNNALKRFEVDMKHNGTIWYRCNNDFYQFVTNPLSLHFGFKKDRRVGTYYMLVLNQPVLSPYASWEIQIVSDNNEDVSQLAAFSGFPIDIELHGTGEIAPEGLLSCDNINLEKVFTKI